MANLSQQKRQRMLEFLNKIKEEHKDDDETLIALDEIENELNSKKYGLVWEKHEEEVDRMMQDNIPVFTEVKEREIKATDENSYNFLLEGDNLHSLKLLEKTHAGKIDVIYIDPPYNTGNQDFIYDDSFVDKTDGYAHSKWLSFMSERLEIAKRLLSDEGAIFISISDVELYNLKLLCDYIFGEQNFVATLVWTNKEGGGSSDSKLFRIKQEYILVYSTLIEKLKIKGVDISNPERYKSTDSYLESRGKYYLQKLGMGSIQYSSSLDFPIECPDGSFTTPSENNNGKKACWRWSKEKLQWGLKNGFIEFKKNINNKWIVYTKQYMNCDNNGNIVSRSQRPMGIIDSFSSTQGAKQQKRVLPNSSFSYPKDTNLISWLIKRVDCKNPTVLDFFAGSGTTAQAVLELNKEDGGNRKFILCTNNENNICEEVTYERIKRVIHGYADVEGIPANLKYFKTDFIAKDADDVSAELLSHIKEMVELENGITLDNKHYLIVLSDEQADELAKNWSNYEDVKAIYVSRNVLFTSEQDALFSNTEIHIIPDYYFEYELKEVGEAW